MSPDSEEFCGALWSRDGELDLVLLHGDLGTEGTLVEQVGLHFNGRDNKLGHLDPHLSHELNSNRGTEDQLILRVKPDQNIK